MIKKRHKYENILGVDITSTQKHTLLREIRSNLVKKRKFYIVTPNPEIVLKAQKNKELMRAINGADIAIPDGIGLKIAINNLNIIKGRELFLDLIKLANKEKMKVYLLGGRGDVAEKSAKALKRGRKRVHIKYSSGFELDSGADPISKEQKKKMDGIIREINEFKPDLLFVAFGAPKQEIWTAAHIDKLDVGGVMVVGGAFDYIAGDASLPPGVFEKYGLEWLWRFVKQPGRIVRILNATVVFPIKVLADKLNNK